MLAGVRTRHYVTNTVFDELGDSLARVRSYVLLDLATGRRGPADRNRRRDVPRRPCRSDGRWLFRERVVIEDPAPR